MTSIWLRNMYVVLMTHIITSIQTTLTGSKLRVLQLINWSNIKKTHTVASHLTSTWVAKLQPSNQIPSTVARGWKYSKSKKFDQIGTQHIMFIEMISYIAAFAKELPGVTNVRREVLCILFCSCVCFAKEHKIKLNSAFHLCILINLVTFRWVLLTCITLIFFVL